MIWKFINGKKQEISDIIEDEYCLMGCEGWMWTDEMLKAAKDYTFEDFENAPIGTKITFDSDIVLVKNSERYFENEIDGASIDAFKNFKDEHYDLGRIVKIEEPTYTTVYEPKDILDNVEKEYLRAVIKPFRNKTKYIVKYQKGTNYEYIDMKIRHEGYISLPNFKKGTMYKGMEINKEYTVEELEL